MRILHTADWHLGDRLRHIDRSGDLSRAVVQVAEYCQLREVDVLVVAGDLFSDLARPPDVQAAITHLSEVFRSFLAGGGTIVAVTGNHDNETFCQTLDRAFQLVSPIDARQGGLLPNGRLYLAVRPTCFRIADPAGREVQFACMPYPLPSRYLTSQQTSHIRDTRKSLKSAFLKKLRELREGLRQDLPRVLVAHITIVGVDCPLFRIPRPNDITISDSAIAGWDYVALGHLHRPQMVGGKAHIRYSGSIDRLDMGERDDNKGVVLLEINTQGVSSHLEFLSLSATPFYDVLLQDPRSDLDQLPSRFPRAAEALVRCRIRYSPGDDSLPEILAELSRLFPRCYERTWARRATNHQRGLVTTRVDARKSESVDPDVALSMPEVVLDYLRSQLRDDDPEREELLALARRLLEEQSDP